MGKTLIFHLQNKSLETFLPEKDFFFLLLFCVCKCAWRINMQIIMKGVHACEHMGDRGHWVSSSLTLHLVTLRKDLSCS